MRKMAIAFATLLTGLVLVGLPGATRPVAAGEIWSWDDPIIEVDGVVVSINLGVRQTDLPAVTGAEVVVTIPAGSTGKVLYIDTTYFTPVVRFVFADGAAVKSQTGPKQFIATVTLQTVRPLDYQIVVQQEKNKATLTQVSSAMANQPTSLVFSLP